MSSIDNTWKCSVAGLQWQENYIFSRRQKAIDMSLCVITDRLHLASFYAGSQRMQVGNQLKSLLIKMGHSMWLNPLFDSFLSCLTEYFLQFHRMFWPRHCGGTSLKSWSSCAKIAAATSSVWSFEKTSDLSVSIYGPVDPTIEHIPISTPAL